MRWKKRKGRESCAYFLVIIDLEGELLQIVNCSQAISLCGAILDLEAGGGNSSYSG